MTNYTETGRENYRDFGAMVAGALDAYMRQPDGTASRAILLDQLLDAAHHSGIVITANPWADHGA